MLYRNQKAARSGDWKYLSIEGDEFLFDLSKDERERANCARRETARFQEMKNRFRAWEQSLPHYPDAAFSVPATKADLAQPS